MLVRRARHVQRSWRGNRVLLGNRDIADAASVCQRVGNRKVAPAGFDARQPDAVVRAARESLGTVDVVIDLNIIGRRFSDEFETLERIEIRVGFHIAAQKEMIVTGALCDEAAKALELFGTANVAVAYAAAAGALQLTEGNTMVGAIWPEELDATRFIELSNTLGLTLNPTVS